MTATTRSKTGGKSPSFGNRWRLQDAKARLSEVVREAQIHGPQRVTLHGRDAVVVVGAAEFDRMQRPVTGRDIVDRVARFAPRRGGIREAVRQIPRKRHQAVRGWLLDTNVISELRKAKPDAGVTAFIEAQPGDLVYVSEITFGEIRYGIEQIEEPSRRADIQFWLDHTIRPLFTGHVTPVTEDVIVRWKMMVVDGQKRGHTWDNQTCSSPRSPRLKISWWCRGTSRNLSPLACRCLILGQAFCTREARRSLSAVPPQRKP